MQQPNRKMGNGLHRHFKEEKMANKYMKRYFTSLGIRKRQTETTMLHTLLHSHRKVKIKKQTILGIREETELSYIVGGYVNWHSVF